MKHISKAALLRLSELRARRDDDCRMLGVAVAEYAYGKSKAYAEHAEDEVPHLHLVLGALTAELDKHQRAILSRIDADLKMQKAVGKTALDELGLDSSARELTIDEVTGEVRELLNGGYVEVKE